jgi:hypothetical protein
MSVVAKDEFEFLLESVRLNGAASASVSDGHLILFTREKLKQLLDSTADNEIITILVKDPSKISGN